MRRRVANRVRRATGEYLDLSLVGLFQTLCKKSEKVACCCCGYVIDQGNDHSNDQDDESEDDDYDGNDHNQETPPRLLQDHFM